MKKLLTLLFVGVFFAGNIVFAQSENVHFDLKSRLEQLDSELKNYENHKFVRAIRTQEQEQKYQQLVNEWLYLQGEYDQKTGKAVKIENVTYKDEYDNLRSVLTNEIVANIYSRDFHVNEYTVIQESDIVVVRYKSPASWTWVSRGHFQHAVLSYKIPGTFIHAPGGDEKVQRGTFNSFFNKKNPDTSKVVEARIVKVNDITNEQRRSVSDYASKFFGVGYPDVPWNKHRTDKIYCTSLAWQSHYHAGKRVDLDVDGGDVVMPSDLLRNPSTTIVTVYFEDK